MPDRHKYFGVLVVCLLFAIGVLVIKTRAPPSNYAHHVATLTALQQSCYRATGCPSGDPIFANGVWRDDYGGTGAPPLFYRGQSGVCSANDYPNSSAPMVNDGGSCVNAADGNSFYAAFPNSDIDPREFGAVANNSTPADAAFAAAEAYASSAGGCVYVPAAAPGFAFQHPLSDRPITSGGAPLCLKGDRVQNFPFNSAGSVPANTFGMPVLHFPNDTDGIELTSKSQDGFYVSNVALIGNAAISSAATHTRGLSLNDAYQGIVQNIYIENFVDCHGYTAPSGRVQFDNLNCLDKYAYPNLTNDYPYAALEFLVAAGASIGNGLQYRGGEWGAQSAFTHAGYSGDGRTRRFQICAPGMTLSGGAGAGTCAGAPLQPNSLLWAADHIRVQINPYGTLPNGYQINNAPYQQCGYSGQAAAYGFDIYDLSSGTPVHLFCTETSAQLTATSATVVVPSTAGYVAGNNILVTGSFGIPLADKVQSVVDSTHLRLTKAPTESGTAHLTIAQIAVSGNNMSAACRSSLSCGANIEVAFTSPPAAGTNNILITWDDPTAYAAVDAENLGEGADIEPNFIGGYRTALKLSAASAVYGSVVFKPTYMELLDQCLSIEANNYGANVEIHKILNPQIPDCPGHIDPGAGPTIVNLNNRITYYNGASPGASTAPGYLSGRFYGPSPAAEIDTAAGVAATDTIYCHPVIFAAPFTIKSLGVYLSATGSGGGVKLAIYATDPATSRPGALLADTGAIASFRAGDNHGSVGRSYSGSPGTYWGCSLWTWRAAPTAEVLRQTSNLFGGALLGSSTIGTNFGNANIGVSYTTSGLYATGYPLSLAGLTAEMTPVPAVWWQER